MSLPLPPDAFDLVQLSTLPESQWRGLPVFHPCEQRGDTAGNLVTFWEATAEDHTDAIELGEPIPEEETVRYDVGVVLDWEPDEHFPGVTRVRFMTGFGSSLRYASYNLWVPRDVVQGIAGPA